MSAVEGGKNAAAGAGGPKQQLKSSNGAKALDSVRKQTGSPVDGQSRKQATPQPKAWQGTNPITQRAAVNAPNGHSPRLPTEGTNSAAADKHCHDRMLFLFANAIGLDANVTLRNGEQFSGVFSGASLEGSGKQYVLKMVKRIKSAPSQQTNGETSILNEYIGEGVDHAMTFETEETVLLDLPSMSLASTPSQQNGSVTSSFRTDTEISGRNPSALRERELQRWEPSGGSSIDMSLGSGGAQEWDQFAENERLYGVQSTYDENIYTTSIDRSDPKYRAREAKAAQIAREIEGSAPADAHVAEERRLNADYGDGLDEEEKYSGVRREALPKRGANSYVPPSQRPITNNPTVPGAPYDPAIISSQLARPTPPPAEAPLEVTKSQENRATTSDAQPAKTSVEAPAAPVIKKDNTTEDTVRNTADAFRQFANFEKLRVRQAQEAKRSSQRHEKNVKLNDLKKFAANFKLNSRVPDDLVPILAKDREKQIEIQKKADDAAKEDEVRRKDKDKPSSSASPAPSATASQTSNTPSAEQRPGNQQNRNRNSQQMRAPPVPAQGQQQQGRAPINQRTSFRGGMAPPQPHPTDLRIPTGPSNPSPMSPSSATRLNVNAFEFRPAASSFTPSGASPSPQRKITPEAPASFFAPGKEPSANKERKDFDSCFDVIKRMKSADVSEEQKKAMAANGGLPLPYRTPPTWSVDQANANLSYKDAFPKLQLAGQGPSPTLHTPSSTGTMPHAHQLPSHLQGGQMGTPSQRPVYYNPQQHGPGQSFHPGMQQQFGPNGSVQNSPRFPHAQVAFNGQMPPHMQYPGQPMPGGYGMSPSMQYRPMPGPPGGPMMMMPGQQQNQMPQMRGQGYGQGQQYGGPQMGGQMMVHNPSGGYANGPMPQQPYSPLPPHAQPHMPHMQGPGGYGGSPRPPMMQHSGSHQGYQPQQPPMHMQQQSPYGPVPGQQPHGYHMQRQMTGGGQYPQMTPRQQAAMPQHPSPGMGSVAQGDEGK